MRKTGKMLVQHVPSFYMKMMNTDLKFIFILLFLNTDNQYKEFFV